LMIIHTDKATINSPALGRERKSQTTQTDSS
jgi:hypothetical protein